MVELELAELAPVLELETAAAAPALHPAVGGNVVATIPLSHGDAEQLFAEADVVVRDRLSMHRHTGAPLEMRGLSPMGRGRRAG